MAMVDELKEKGILVWGVATLTGNKNICTLGYPNRPTLVYPEIMMQQLSNAFCGSFS